MKGFCIACLASCALALAHPSSAQQTVDYASIGGRVTDPSGAVVVGAFVLVRQTATNVVSSVETDREGRFRFPYLRVGSYEVSVHKDGFRGATQPLVLTVGAAFEL